MQPMRSITIDGPSGAGKSTLARALAKALNFLYVDTGAIYRTVSLYVKERGVDPADAAGVEALLPEIDVALTYGEDGLQHMFLNGKDVTDAIRLPEVSLLASKVSAIPAVRAFLLQKQRSLAETNNVIMDGRDIGTVVLPKADVKIFLKASPEERVHRRFLELQERGTPQDYAPLLEEIRQRDYNDSHRAVSPLRPAEDAMEIDTTGYTFEESFQLLLKTIKEKL